MDTPHISPRPVEKKEIHNNNLNDAITLGTNRKFTTNRQAIAPRHTPMKEILVHPYKLFNFTNEYYKDISNLYNDPCLSPNYSRSHNFKDKKYRGNQFGVRYSRNQIFNRPTQHMKYSNSRLYAQYPQIVKQDPWFVYNWSHNRGDGESDSLRLTNNRQDVYRNFFKSHPFYYYRDLTTQKHCEKPIVQLPHFLEGFANLAPNTNWLLFLLPIVLILIARNVSFKL